MLLGQLFGAFLGKKTPETGPAQSLEAQKTQQTRDFTNKETPLATYGKEGVSGSSPDVGLPQKPHSQAVFRKS